MLPVLLVRYILKMGRDRPRLCAWVYKRIRFDAKQETVYKMIASLLLCSCFIVVSIVGQEDDFVLYPVADLSHPEIPYHHGPFLHYYLSIPQNKFWFSCNNNLKFYWKIQRNISTNSGTPSSPVLHPAAKLESALKKSLVSCLVADLAVPVTTGKFVASVSSSHISLY
jgi:hypothetical protein